MLQVVQYVKTGELKLEDVPAPVVQPGMVRVQTECSLISAGTEKMVIDLAQKSMAGMARQRPDLVKQVVTKARKEGVVGTYKAVMSKMNKPIALGYSAAGTIIEVGPGVSKFTVGDRVAIAGGGYACHAEINTVPVNLVAKIPEGVSMEEASYSTVAAIALQGVRLADLELGDFVLVSGLGLIGLITVQLLKASGCRVVGIDPMQARIDQANELGIDLALKIGSSDVEAQILDFSKGYGVDKTIITASTKSNQPIEFAGAVTRKKGAVVVVGAVGMKIPRDIYYHKELSLAVSMSYGPGRYDPSYEEGGIDYPYEYVRWTEQRNIEAILGLLAGGQLNTKDLTSHRIPIAEAMSAYEMIKEGKEAVTGVVLEYDTSSIPSSVLNLKGSSNHDSKSSLSLGFIGAGNYASLMLLPNLKGDSNVNLKGLATRTGVSARAKGDQFGFEFVSTDSAEVIENSEIDTVFITTRHASHAKLSIASLQSGKHTFVEKPMCVFESDLDQLKDAYIEANTDKATALMVGLNRRFAPLTQSLKKSFASQRPLQMSYRVNSGHIPASSWHHEEAEGSSMLVGEMIHFIDLIMYFAESKPTSVFATSLDCKNAEIADEDNTVIILRFENGTVGTLNYNTVGDKGDSKERLEIFGGGKVGVLDDFMRASISKGGSKSKIKGKGQDKGQRSMLKSTIENIKKSGQAPIPFEDLYLGMKVIFAARKSIQSGEVQSIS